MSESNLSKGPHGTGKALGVLSKKRPATAKSLGKTIFGTGRFLLALVLVLSQTAWAGQNHKPKESTDVARAAAKQGAAEAPSAGGPHEGIKVHGHWTIEVRNSDGKLVTHREFENALAQLTGSGALTSLLAGTRTLDTGSSGAWAVWLIGNPEPCFESSITNGGPNATVCQIVQTTNTSCSGCSATFNNLTVSGATGSVMLSGSATAGLLGNVNQVSTLITVCTPPGCSDPTQQAFTIASLTTPVAVSPGQTIAVTVVISFS